MWADADGRIRKSQSRLDGDHRDDADDRDGEEEHRHSERCDEKEKAESVVADVEVPEDQSKMDRFIN